MVGILIACMLALCTLVSAHVVEREVAGVVCVEVDCCEGEEEVALEIAISDPIQPAGDLDSGDQRVITSRYEPELLRPPDT